MLFRKPVVHERQKLAFELQVLQGELHTMQLPPTMERPSAVQVLQVLLGNRYLPLLVLQLVQLFEFTSLQA